jgi:hypothetical protein
MLASGIGIAAQIPYLKEFINGRKERALSVQSVLLVWEIDSISERSHAPEWSFNLMTIADLDWVMG